MGTRDVRRAALARVEAIYAGEATWDDFVSEFGANDDPPIADLVRLIQQEPDRDGPAAVPDWAYQAYRTEIELAVVRLGDAAEQA